MQPHLKIHQTRGAAALSISLLALAAGAYGQNMFVSLDTSARSSTVAEPAGYRGSASEGSSVSSHNGSGGEEPSAPSSHHGHATSGGGSHENNGAWVGSKGGMPAAPPVAEKPQLVLSAEGGYQSKYIWRGVDLVQFTSYNAYYNGTPGAKISAPEGDVYFLGMSATYNGWAFGVKYVESLSHDFNPFFAPLLSTRDAYSEYIFSANYTYALLPDRWLNATAGFDFYYYPNGEFWGVDHQGLAYLRFVTPHYQWAQPFLNLFYNVPTTSQGRGLATGNFRQGLDGNYVTGAKLVEGCGFELGAAGGAEVARTGNVGYGVSYSLSTTYKNGYAYEPNGFSHITASLSAPVTIGQNLTIAPSVNYVYALKSINSPYAPGASVWNYPGWWFGLKATYSF